MPFEDLAQYVRPGFDLPYGGKAYFVPAPNSRDGLWLQALMDGSASLLLTRSLGAANRQVLLDDEQERTVYQLALGSAHDEMVNDGLPWPVLKHAGVTAWMYWTRSEKAAEDYWATLADGAGKAGPAESSSTNSPPDGSPTETTTPTPA